jgi:hypothetical protein
MGSIVALRSVTTVKTATRESVIVETTLLNNLSVMRQPKANSTTESTMAMVSERGNSASKE